MVPYCVKWFKLGNVVKLLYSDGSILFVSREDFDRCFGPIVSSSYSDIKRDFAIFA